MGSGSPDAEDRKHVLRKAREDAVAFIGISARTSGAVAASLRRSGYPEDVVDEVVAGLQEAGYPKDREIARRLLERASGKSTESRAALRERMIRRGVPTLLVEEVLSSAEEDRISASALLSAAFPASELAGPMTASDANRMAVRMVRFLSSRGYDPETAEEAVRKALDRFDG